MTDFSSPISGGYQISSPFGMRDGGMHNGVDMAAPLGTPILAAAAGTVAAAGSASGFGQWIVLDHIINGKKWSTVYGHMYPAGVLVHTGAIVSKGQHIADVGANGEATGPHLHFEVWDGGRLTGGHAVDPMGALSGSAAPAMGVETAGFQNASVWSALNPVNQAQTLAAIWNFISFVIDPHNWYRVFLFLCGAAAMLYVLWSMMMGGIK